MSSVRLFTRQPQRSQEKLAHYHCAVERAVGGGGGCSQFDKNESIYFPNELDDLVYYPNAPSDLSFESLETDFTLPNFHDLSEINPLMQGYEPTNVLTCERFDKPSSGMSDGDFQIFASMIDDHDLISSIMAQCKAGENIEESDCTEAAGGCKATKAYTHLDSTTTTHPNPPSKVQTDTLEDFIGDLDSFDCNHFSDIDFLHSAEAVDSKDPSLLGTALAFTDEATFKPLLVLSDHASLSSSSSSDSLSSLSSSSQPLPPSSPPTTLSSQLFNYLSTSSLTLTTSPQLAPFSLFPQQFSPKSESSPPHLSASSSSTSLVMRPEKRLRKKEQNKSAALRYRKKKRNEYVDFLKECEDVEKRNAQLKNRVTEIAKEISYLKGLMTEISAIKSS